MSYLLIKNDSFVRRIGGEQIDWDATHSCSADALTNDEKLSFGVVTVFNTPQPTFDRLSQNCVEIGPALINGVWTQQWVVLRANAVEIERRGVDAVQQHLDAVAAARGYDGILSACTYAVDTHPTFKSEGQACVNWRGAVWASCYQILAEVQAGTRTAPTEQELIALLPAIVWPV